jgi:hypothetical protein
MTNFILGDSKTMHKASYVVPSVAKNAPVSILTLGIVSLAGEPVAGYHA